LDVYINGDLYKKLKELVVTKHELLHGALSYEVEEPSDTR
jgi:hypothetical protein